MREGFRQSMAWLHTWTGLVVGWVLYFVFVTGTAGYFYVEIDRWMKPELPLAGEAIPSAQAVAVAQSWLQQRAPGADSWSINLQAGRDAPNLTVSWRDPPKPGERRGRGGNHLVALDGGGEVIGSGEPRETGGGFLLYRMHYQLHYFEYDTAVLIVGVCTMFMLMAILTGIVTHKKIFKDFFTFRPDKGQRSWLDAHNVISVTALPFFLMITYSGLLFFLADYMPAGIGAQYGFDDQAQERFYQELSPRLPQPERGGGDAPLIPLTQVLAEAEREWGAGQVRNLSVQMPGDANARITLFRVDGSTVARSERLLFGGAGGERIERSEPGSAAQSTNDVMLALHEGRFAQIALRWLYFLTGALGVGMIATGLVLWTVKRRPQQAKAGGFHFGHALVERLNLATIAGLPIGIAAYFWANRLLPVDFDGRRDWEVHLMFIAWGCCFLHAGLRPLLRGWVEQLAAAATLFALIPLLNALTTQRHLGVSLPQGDWVLAGFDLTMLALAAVFGWAALRVQRKRLAVPSPRRRARAPVREVPATEEPA